MSDYNAWRKAVAKDTTMYIGSPSKNGYWIICSWDIHGQPVMCDGSHLQMMPLYDYNNPTQRLTIEKIERKRNKEGIINWFPVKVKENYEVQARCLFNIEDGSEYTPDGRVIEVYSRGSTQLVFIRDFYFMFNMQGWSKILPYVTDRSELSLSALPKIVATMPQKKENQIIWLGVEDIKSIETSITKKGTVGTFDVSVTVYLKKEISFKVPIGELSEDEAVYYEVGEKYANITSDLAWANVSVKFLTLQEASKKVTNIGIKPKVKYNFIRRDTKCLKGITEHLVDVAFNSEATKFIIRKCVAQIRNMK